MKYRGFEIKIEVDTEFTTGVLITVTFSEGDYCTSDRMALIDQFIDEYNELNDLDLSPDFGRSILMRNR